MSLLTAAIRRAPLRSIRFPVSGLSIPRAMHIQSIPMWEGSGNNYAYLVSDDKTREAVIIDPAHPKEVLPVLDEKIKAGLKLSTIINTHQ